MAVKFHFLHPVTLPHRTRLKLLIGSLFSREAKACTSLDIIFCSDAYLLDINRRFLSHNYFTDIITFDLAEAGLPTEGEIYISVETAELNAKKYNVLKTNELNRLIVHGCLHLCGYGDKSRKEKILMTEKENEYLSLFETL